MFEDVLDALIRSGRFDRIAVLTNDLAMENRASRLGCEVFEEDTRLSYRATLARVAAEIQASGFHTLIHVAADLPCLQPDDIDRLLSMHQGGVTVCVATKDDGTNGLVCTPPTVIVPCFGAPSRERHMTIARSKGVNVRSATIRGFALDIDEHSDLLRLGHQRCVGKRTRAALGTFRIRRYEFLQEERSLPAPIRSSMHIRVDGNLPTPRICRD